jgi:hypothetical protein
MGTSINIRSTYKSDNSGTESFLVPINVIKWLADDTSAHWDFDIEDAEPLPSAGVEILVKDLTEETVASFGDPAFMQNLRRTIARDYALHLHRGLAILLNGQKISGWQIEMRASGDFAPTRVQYQDEVDGGPVNVEIVAGMAAPPPENSDPDGADDYENRFGWYFVCNGRIVLAANRDEVSGWGTEDWPQWHPQYNGFVGFILFTAENAARLRLTTTKRSIDRSSVVYRRARPRMRDVSKQWIN